MNMIERVAKAIYEKLNMRGNACLSDYGDDLGDVVVDGRVDLLCTISPKQPSRPCEETTR
jgi:hypothetical protein